MVAVRTTFRPWEEIEVSEDEYWNLLRQNTVSGYYGTLTAVFRMYEGGPPATVTNVTITISKDAETFVGPTSTGVQNTGDGSYAYPWSEGDRDGPGDYLIHWEAVDETETTIIAEETITLEE